MSVDSENEKILQEFMDVLDNQEEENGNHQNPQHPAPKKTEPKVNTVSQPQVPVGLQQHFKSNSVNTNNQQASQKEYPEPMIKNTSGTFNSEKEMMKKSA